MGSAQHRSWSHSRQFIADQCQRALYFAYFPWGDDDQDLARFIKKQVTTPQIYAGFLVDKWIKFGLLQLKEFNDYPTGLAEAALKEFDKLISSSKKVAKIAKTGKRPPDREKVFLHHLYGSEGLIAQGNARQIVCESLLFFETSPFLNAIRNAGSANWYTLLTDTEDIPYFFATEALGFSSSIGHRVYTAYDFAFTAEDVLYIQDWKTGQKNPRKEQSARRQLAAYSLWGMSLGYSLDQIQVQACWLNKGESWSPTSLSQTDIDDAIATIETEDKFERDVLNPIADKNGEIQRYEANREDFPPSPSIPKCEWCLYRAICSEGKQMVKGNREAKTNA